jgi:hypothetical protein
MRRIIVAVAVAVAVLGSTATARAANGPSNRCYGEIIAGTSSTWPWAHDGRIDFQPPPGAVALWIQLFGPDVGISSVRELQVLFCSE